MFGTTQHVWWCSTRVSGDISRCSCERTIRAGGGYVNALLLALVAVYVAFEAFERYMHPREILTPGMMAIALLGAALNYLQHAALKGGHEREIVRYVQVLGIGGFIFVAEIAGSYWSGSLALFADAWHVLADNGAAIVSIIVAWLVPARDDKDHVTHTAMHKHVWSDLWQSVTVFGGGLAIYLTGYNAIDPLLSFGIAMLMLYWAFDIAAKVHQGVYGKAHHH